MRDHLHHRPIEPHAGALEAPGIAHDLVDHEGPEGHETHMRNRGVRDELLHVLLHQRDETDVDHRDQRQRDQQQVELAARVRGNGQAEAQEAVATHLQQDGRQDHRAAGGRLDVRIRQPGVHREHRHLHREGEQQREEDPALLGERERQGLQARDRVAATLHVHVDQRRQHEHRAEEGVQEELDGRVHAPRPAPDADDEEHRNQHRLPEEIEQQRVGGGKHPDHQAFHDEEGAVVLRRARLDHPPAGDHYRYGHERGEHEQRQRDAVHAERVPGVKARNPRQLLRELQRRGGGVERAPQRHRQPQRRHRGEQRQPAPRHDVAIAEQQDG